MEQSGLTESTIENHCWRGESTKGADVKFPLVTILIVTWNRKEDVLEAVRSVYYQAYSNCEIIVVDNASTDGTVEALHTTFPSIKLIILDRNIGASAGRNPGIIAAKGEIIFLLDSDATLGYDTLVNVVDKFWCNPTVGAITCKILGTKSRELDAWNYTEEDKADQDIEFFSFSFAEGGVAIRKEVFDKVGLFWDLLFFGREGEELSLRIWDARYEILYYPQAVVYHRGSSQKQITRGELEYYNLRNCLYIYCVHYPWYMLVSFSFLKIGSSLVRGIKQGNLRHVVKALHDVGKQLPTLIKKRHPISDATARRYLKLQREHGSLRWNLISWLKYKT